MKDTIYRADAIEAVKDAYEMDVIYKVISEDIINALSALPSADAVSREDYHNLLTASDDIDRALREYQAKEEHASADDTFCKSQLITCNWVKSCNGVCPFEDAIKHADKTKTINEQHTVNHDRDWIIGCIEHDGFIHTHRFDKANQIIHDALSAEAVQGWRTGKPKENGEYMVTIDAWGHRYICIMHYNKPQMPNIEVDGMCWYRSDDEWGDVVYDDSDIIAWMPLPYPYKGE